MQEYGGFACALCASWLRACAEACRCQLSHVINVWCGQDAKWMTSVKCETVGQVYLLLKSSDLVAYDLDHASVWCCWRAVAACLSCSRVCMRSFSRCADGSGARVDAFELALKQWCNYVPAMEFRCFVRTSRTQGCGRAARSHCAWGRSESPLGHHGGCWRRACHGGEQGCRSGYDAAVY